MSSKNSLEVYFKIKLNGKSFHFGIIESVTLIER